MRNPIAVLFLISCFFVKLARAQSDELLVLGQTGNLHLEHTVVAKENWYSVGRLYNLPPKDLTTYNKLTLAKPLVIGQKLEIPLTAVNFSQNGQKGATEALVPVYHIVQEKEWMYRISVNHNKVPIPNLEKWNKMNKDQVRAGMHLVVGYLKVKTALSALAKPGGAAGAAVSGGVKEGGVEGAKEGVEESKGSVRVKGESDSTVMTAPAVSKASEGKETKKAEGQAGKTEVEGKRTEVETKKTEVEGRKPAVETKKLEVETKKPEVEGKRTEVEGRKVEGGEVKAGEGVTASSHNGGIFKGDFSESGKSASGTAGTFKSSSGWQDGKYYALMNNIAVGTIVKVSDGYTGKIIYAKVLGALPDMKESAGLTIRISNAAASELGEGEGRFNVAVSY